jgi:multicomponent Na+:H+ antiporter subunit C
MTIASSVLHATAAALFAIGLFTIVARGNLIKKLVGLALLQMASWTVLVGLSAGPASDEAITNPLPVTIALAAMTAGVVALAVGIDLVLRIRASAVSTEDDEITAHESKS